MTTSNASSNPGVPLGKGAPDETARTPPTRNPGSEEPDMLLESDLPSDGRDEKGEAMIRDLPQRPELSEPPSQPGPSNNSKP